ncbi:hypothetical protein [Ignicoccus hospitalis]|uniref:hypothetical protein n=1 Tax=Ignicoccus hospitalis TaxID=160233 RepID=UPI0011D13AF0|nr:hypothetical protein [Ignicoccus hospitalis]
MSGADVDSVEEGDGGEIEVTWEKFEFSEILVGSLESPEAVVFIHYDSFEGGSVDNGAAVAVALERLKELDLKKTLLAFTAPDEPSHEEPYWGFGFRFFEKEFKDVLESADVIVTFDSVGLSSPLALRDKKSLEDLLPLEDKGLLEKAVGVTSDWDKLFEIYHSDLDTPDKVDYSKTVEA